MAADFGCLTLADTPPTPGSGGAPTGHASVAVPFPSLDSPAPPLTTAPATPPPSNALPVGARATSPGGGRRGSTGSAIPIPGESTTYQMLRARLMAAGRSATAADPDTDGGTSVEVGIAESPAVTRPRAHRLVPKSRKSLNIDLNLHRRSLLGTGLDLYSSSNSSIASTDGSSGHDSHPSSSDESHPHTAPTTPTAGALALYHPQVYSPTYGEFSAHYGSNIVTPHAETPGQSAAASVARRLPCSPMSYSPTRPSLATDYFASLPTVTSPSAAATTFFPEERSYGSRHQQRRPPHLQLHPRTFESHSTHPSPHGHGCLPASARGVLDVIRDPPPERNRVEVSRIEQGMDTRTTVMLKNVPNKMSDRNLIDFIKAVCSVLFPPPVFIAAADNTLNSPMRGIHRQMYNLISCICEWTS
jgi:hypothetical protein